MFIFQGIRSSEGVFVTCNGAWFDPSESLKVRNHSPDGFNWGYGGSGPAQLALAILLKFLPTWAAEKLYQRFKAEVIAGLNSDGWLLTPDEVQAWTKRNAHRLAPEYQELDVIPNDVLEVLGLEDVTPPWEGESK